MHIRRVRSPSGATEVSVAQKEHGRLVIVKHIGSAHTDFELEVLLRRAQEFMDDARGPMLPFDEPLMPLTPRGWLIGASEPDTAQSCLFDAPARLEVPQGSRRKGSSLEGTCSVLLGRVLQQGYQVLGFDALGDDVFKKIVVARLARPTSKSQVPSVLGELGIQAPHLNTIYRHLHRAQSLSYRDVIAKKCFEHASTSSDVSSVLYDVTTLYWEC